MSSNQAAPFESEMDLPAPRPPQEVAGSPENTPVTKQGSEVNPEFLPPVGAVPTPVSQPPADNTQAAVPAAPAAVPSPAASHQKAAPTASENPVLAEDVDLIEKEWVEKAKAIVNHTKNDPYKQNHEINKMKADYIKKRYNKDIQVSE